MNTPTREALLAGKVSERWESDSVKEQARFEQFCKRLSLPHSAEAVVLYLTWMTEDQGVTGPQAQERLKRLDHAARVAGREPWRRQPMVGTFLRGLHRRLAEGSVKEKSDPLYRELVDVLVEAVMQPTRKQLLDRSAVLLAFHGSLRASDLARLTWRDIRLTRHSVTVTPYPRPTSTGPKEVPEFTIPAVQGPLCAVATLRRLREHGHRPNDQPFHATRGRPNDRVQAALRLPRHDRSALAETIARLSISPEQARDRAILLLSYGAALTTIEASALNQGHFTETSEGLLVDVPGRSAPTGIPGEPGSPCDPVHAWHAWEQILSEGTALDPALPAFPRIWNHYGFTHRIGRAALTGVVERAAQAAGITDGTYTFSSLRWGLIRTAVRADEPLHAVAQHVDIGIDRAARHHRREHLVRRSVAGQLGL